MPCISKMIQGSSYRIEGKLSTDEFVIYIYSCVIQMEYAVRGQLLQKAARIEEDIHNNMVSSLPKINNMYACGTFFRVTLGTSSGGGGGITLGLDIALKHHCSDTWTIHSSSILLIKRKD